MNTENEEKKHVRRGPFERKWRNTGIFAILTIVCGLLSFGFGRSTNIGASFFIIYTISMWITFYLFTGCLVMIINYYIKVERSELEEEDKNENN